MSTYNQDWDRLLNPHRYDGDGNLTDAAKQQDVHMQLNSTGGGGGGGAGGSGDLKVETPALDTASKNAAALRGDISKATNAPDEPNRAAAGSLKTEKFELGPALDKALTTWDTKSANLCGAFAKLEKALWSGARDTELVESDNKASMSDYMKHYR